MRHVTSSRQCQCGSACHPATASYSMRVARCLWPSSPSSQHQLVTVAVYQEIGRALTTACAPVVSPTCVRFTSASGPSLWPCSHALRSVGSSSRGSQVCCCSAVVLGVVLERLTGNRCVSEQQVLRFHAIPGACGGGRRLGRPYCHLLRDLPHSHFMCSTPAQCCSSPSSSRCL